MRRKIAILFSLMLMLTSKVSAENIVTNMKINSTPEEWGTNVFGEWSFWAVKEYYSVDSTIGALPEDGLDYVDVDNDLDLSADNKGYGTAKINPAGDFTYKGFLDSANKCNIKDKLDGPGIVIAAKPNFYNDDCTYNSDMATYPNSADDMVRFRAGNILSKNHKDVAVMFTVPETGNYNIYLDTVNKGETDSSGNRLYGSSNFGRISIIPTGESKETKENSVNFRIPNANENRDITYNATTELQAGTRIFLRMHNGMDMWNDDLFAKFIITQYDEKGGILKVYDLNQVGYSNIDNIRFSTSENGVIDSTKYLPLFAAKPINVKSSPSFEDGYVSTVVTNEKWASAKVNMQSTPSIAWNCADGKLQVKSDVNKDIIMTYTFPEDGRYKVYTSAAYTTKVMQKNTAVKVSCIRKNELKETPVLAKIDLLPGSTKEKSSAFADYFNAGDKIVYRIEKSSQSFTFWLTPYVDKIDKDFSVDFDFDDDIKDHIGSTITADLDVLNLTDSDTSVQFFACQYSSTGKLISLTKAEPKEAVAWENASVQDFQITLSPEVVGGQLKIYAWSDMDTADVIADNMVIDL